jgi:hypothetical protein
MQTTAESKACFSPRERAWIVLSELFRDTETQSFEYDDIARTLLAEGLTSAQAEAILFGEVAPVFGKNLVSVAGNWTGWSDEFVVREMHVHLARHQYSKWPRLFSLDGWLSAWLKHGLAQDWAQIQRRMDAASTTV